jgi:hypothetical protein
MKISQLLRNYREYYFKNNGRDLPAYDVLMNYEDFRELLAEDEARLNYRETETGLHWFENFHVFRSPDVKKGDIIIIENSIRI